MSEELELQLARRAPSTLDPYETERRCRRLGSVDGSEGMWQARLGLIRGARPALPDIAPLLRTLCGRKSWRTRAVVAWALNQLDLTPEQQAQAADALLDVVDARLPKPRFGPVSTFLRPWVITLPVTILIEAVALGRFSLDADFLSALPILFIICQLCLAPFLIPAFQMSAFNRETQVRAAAARSLGFLGGAESAGALARLEMHGHRTLHSAGKEGLMQLLPRLTAADYGKLDADTIPELCRLLTGANEREGMIVLAALEQVGDGRAAAAVRWLSTARNKPQALRDEAVRILPILEERQRKAGDPSRMLRAAEPAPGGALLRPAASTPAEEPALLRAAEEP